MPYKSSAQQKYFHYLESKGKMPKKTVKEFDESTNYEDLPEHVEKYSHGGRVPEENFDEQEGDASEYDSSGEPNTEPNTEDKLEDEEPMEYMAKGGMIKKMSRGGKVNPRFAKALSKAR